MAGNDRLDPNIGQEITVNTLKDIQKKGRQNKKYQKQVGDALEIFSKDPNDIRLNGKYLDNGLYSIDIGNGRRMIGKVGEENGKKKMFWSFEGNHDEYDEEWKNSKQTSKKYDLQIEKTKAANAEARKDGSYVNGAEAVIGKGKGKTAPPAEAAPAAERNGATSPRPAKAPEPAPVTRKEATPTPPSASVTEKPPVTAGGSNGTAPARVPAPAAVTPPTRATPVPTAPAVPAPAASRPLRPPLATSPAPAAGPVRPPLATPPAPPPAVERNGAAPRPAEPTPSPRTPAPVEIHPAPVNESRPAPVSETRPGTGTGTNHAVNHGGTVVTAIGELASGHPGEAAKIVITDAGVTLTSHLAEKGLGAAEKIAAQKGLSAMSETFKSIAPKAGSAVGVAYSGALTIKDCIEVGHSKEALDKVMGDPKATAFDKLDATRNYQYSVLRAVNNGAGTATGFVPGLGAVLPMIVGSAGNSAEEKARREDQQIDKILHSRDRDKLDAQLAQAKRDAGEGDCSALCHSHDKPLMDRLEFLERAVHQRDELKKLNGGTLPSIPGSPDLPEAVVKYLQERDKNGAAPGTSGSTPDSAPSTYRTPRSGPRPPIKDTTPVGPSKAQPTPVQTAAHTVS